jgi:MFS family permease
MIETAADEQTARETATAAAPGGQPRFGFGATANTLLGYTLVKGLQMTLHNLIFPLYAYSLGYNQETIGRLNATGALMVLVASVPLGMLADRIGRARLLTISGFLLPVSLLGVGLASSLPALVFWMLVQNAIAVIYWSATSPLLIGAVTAEQRVRAFSINSFFLWGVGALGSLIGGGIAAGAAGVLGVSSDDTAALRAALIFNALLTLVGGLPLWRIRNLESAGDNAAGRAPLNLSDLRLFGRLLVPDMLQACGSGAIIGFLPLFFTLRFGVEPGPLGAIFTLTGVLGGITALSAPLFVRRLGHVRAIGSLMGGIAACIALLVTMPFLAGAVFFETARAGLRGTIDPIYTPYAISRVAPERRGTLAGLYNVTYATGFSLGPLISGWIQVNYGFSPAFIMSAAAYILAAVAMLVLWRSLPGEAQTAPAAAGATA